MHRNSSGYLRYIVVGLALAAIFGGLATAAVEKTVPVGSQQATQAAGTPGASDDEASDATAVDGEAEFNTVEDMLLFRGPLATLWAAPRPVVASVEWQEVTPEPTQGADEREAARAAESDE